MREGGEIMCGTSVTSFLPALEGSVPQNDHMFLVGGEAVANSVPAAWPGRRR